MYFRNHVADLLDFVGGEFWIDADLVDDSAIFHQCSNNFSRRVSHAYSFSVNDKVFFCMTICSKQVLIFRVPQMVQQLFFLFEMGVF